MILWGLLMPVLGLLAGPIRAQHSGWDQGQVNSTMCTWRLPRVITLRDTVYLDGGDIMWLQGMDTGEYKRIADGRNSGNPKGLILTLNLTTRFSLDQNLTQLFNTLAKFGTSSAVPNYVDGDLLGNDAQFFTYGGLTLKSDSLPDPDKDETLEYQAYPYDSDVGTFSAGFVNEKLPSDITRYLAYGAAVNAPSENKAWYFSGLRSPSGGVIYDSFAIQSAVPSNISNTLITLTFDSQAQNIEKWENRTLPASVSGRASASGVFVPVGGNGILVFVGGVTHPEFASSKHKSDNPPALQSDSEAFIKSIDIYDIGNDKWFRQETSSSESPPVTAQGCAVVQHASDFSSFNIYYYGGYTGEDRKEGFSDDVWILTMPSFKWIKAHSGTEAHARAGHKCVSPYPDQMMVFGGFTPKLGSGPTCLEGGVIQLFNLTSLEWIDSYSPVVYAEYGVPEAVRKEIGGESWGGATANSPAASGGWSEESLQTLFETPYPSERIKTWYPYEPVEPSSRPGVSVSGEGKKSGSKLPGWVPPMLGAVLGLIAVVLVGIAIFVWRRRRILRAGSRHGSVSTAGPKWYEFDKHRRSS
ncbi:hypothetical protein jhhlp_005918 [Lomentospora prolificans]|uniref:Kelch repeat protein n=1 Tax=Lomentospora prolificans TaxID=41688 RepID=A0A2N3N4G4_9PEZI|nr:hypothetical protein jhhlp_005918 [Lomentospora prolificans]